MGHQNNKSYTTETSTRSLVKTITWRIVGSSAVALISYVITGSLAAATSIGLSQVLISSVLYWLHERAWARVRWGLDQVQK